MTCACPHDRKDGKMQRVLLFFSGVTRVSQIQTGALYR